MEYVVELMGARVMVKTRRQNRTGVRVAMLMAVAAIGLTACDTVKSSGMDPIDWYRDLSGDFEERRPGSGP